MIYESQVKANNDFAVFLFLDYIDTCDNQPILLGFVVKTLEIQSVCNFSVSWTALLFIAILLQIMLLNRQLLCHWNFSCFWTTALFLVRATISMREP